MQKIIQTHRATYLDIKTKKDHREHVNGNTRGKAAEQPAKKLHRHVEREEGRQQIKDAKRIKKDKR